MIIQKVKYNKALHSNLPYNYKSETKLTKHFTNKNLFKAWESA